MKKPLFAKFSIDATSVDNSGVNGIGWLHTDEAQDVVASLRHLSKCIVDAGSDPREWKWVILSLHSALQGSLVCHISGTMNVEALEKRSAEAWVSFLNANPANKPAELPKERLAELPVLIKRLSGADADFKPYGGVISLDNAENLAFKKLCSLRNDFTHFKPSGWAINLSGMPSIVAHVAAVIGRIDKAGWAFRHLNDADRDSLREDVSFLLNCPSP